MEEEKIRYCPICKKRLKPSDSYTFKDGKKDTYCKDCRLVGCSDSQPWTYFPIMQLFNIPYIEREWLLLLERQKQNPKIINNASNEIIIYPKIFGKYNAKMRLCSFRDWEFKDSPTLNDPQKTKQIRECFLGQNIPQQYYNVIGLNNE